MQIDQCNPLTETIKMGNNLYIIGAGSVGGHIASNPKLYDLNYDNIFFLDDDLLKVGTMFVGCQVVGTSDSLLNLVEKADVVIGIAFPKVKEAIVNKLKYNPNLSFPTLVAQNAWLSEGVVLGEGCVIYPNCSVNYGSILKNFVVMNMNCALGHHTYIDNYSSLAPGVNFGGHTHLGVGVEMGIGSATLQGIKIGDYAIIGGQALIIKNVSNNQKIVGVPGRLL